MDSESPSYILPGYLRQTTIQKLLVVLPKLTVDVEIASKDGKTIWQKLDTKSRTCEQLTYSTSTCNEDDCKCQPISISQVPIPKNKRIEYFALIENKDLDTKTILYIEY